MIELDGSVGQISYRNGGWYVEVELKQALPRCDIFLENGKTIHSDSFKSLGSFVLNISKDDALSLTQAAQPIPDLKLLVEIKK